MDLAILQAQDDFVKEFGNAYPLCETVGHGLRILLESCYNGSQQDFTAKFVQPTLELLRSLKAGGFPLVKDGYIIVHLVVPVDRLESSEMFFQVGRTTPGTLALKFAKYDARSGAVFQQPSEVGREDYNKAFTLNYLEDLRSKAANLGDQLMRVLLVSVHVPSVPLKYNVGKIEAKQVIPRGSPSFSNPVCESAGHRMVRMPSQNDEYPSHAIPPSQLCHEPVQVSDADCSQTPQRVTFSEAEYPDNHTAANWSPDRVQDVMSSHVALPVQVLQSGNIKEEDQPIPDAAEVLLSDSRFPPTKECMSRNGVMQASVSNTMVVVLNPKYPPVRSAVKDNEASVWKMKSGTEEELSPKSASNSNDNPRYPPTRAAVQSQAEGTKPNPEYPPITDAVKDNTWCAMIGGEMTTLSVAGAHNPAYPPAKQAVKFSSGCPSAAHPDCATQGDAVRKQDGGVSSSIVTGPRNILYPLPEDVMFQSGKIRGGHNERETLIHGAKDNNSAYPPVGEALGSMLEGASSNPKYPPVLDAIKGDGQGTLTVAGTASVRNTETSNPTYPPLEKAVESSSDCASSNPKYPPVLDAIKGDGQGTLTVAGTGSVRNTQTSNPTYPPLAMAVDSSSDCASSNPKYPPVLDAIKGDGQCTLTVAGTGSVRNTQTSNPTYPPLATAVDSSSDCASSNPRYPPVLDAIKGDGQGTLTVAGTGSVRNTETSNPTYPPLATAVESSSDCASFNPKYPLIFDAVKHDAHIILTIQGTDSRGVSGDSKLVFPPPEEALQFNAQRHNEGATSLNITETSTPSYSPTEGVESTCASSNPKYPAVTEAVKNNTQGALTEGGSAQTSVTGVNSVVCPPEEDAKFPSSKPRGGHAKEVFVSDLTGAANVVCPQAGEAVQSPSGCAGSNPSQQGGGEGARKCTPDKSSNNKVQNNIKECPDFLEDDDNSLF